MFENFGQGLGNIFGNLFTDQAKPYQKAQHQYQGLFPQAQQYYQQAEQVQNPFYQAGTGSIQGYQNWLQGMQDPSQFINHIMGRYRQSPWATQQQDQAQRAAMNAASAGGLLGSTPMTQFAAQQARDITSQDQQNYLQNVLGINSLYGAGLGGLLGMGQNAGNIMSQLFGQQGQNQIGYAENMANLAYQQEQAKQKQRGGLFGGIFNSIF